MLFVSILRVAMRIIDIEVVVVVVVCVVCASVRDPSNRIPFLSRITLYLWVAVVRLHKLAHGPQSGRKYPVKSGPH